MAVSTSGGKLLSRTTNKFVSDLRYYGKFFALLNFFKNLSKAMLYKFLRFEMQDGVGRVQNRLSKRFFYEFDGRIKYGPFSNMKLMEDSSWGKNSRSAILFGLYEKEILDKLVELSNKYRYFIDLGAADGYYGIGAVLNHYFEQAFCYESSKKGREIISKAAIINGVSSSVFIRGTATSDFYCDFNQEARDNSVILVDIEGGEFEIFNASVFEAFQNSSFIIELHEWMVPDGNNKLDKLRKVAGEYFEIEELKMCSRDPGAFHELQNLPDFERWLICSEGRDQTQNWIVLTPKTL